MIPRHAKYVMVIGFLIFILLVLRSGVSEDEEVAAYEQHLKELQERRLKNEREQRAYLLGKNQKRTHVQKPIDYKVQFISGKEMVEAVDGEHRAIQIHRVKMENLEEIDALVQCKDPFSKFSQIIKPGEFYEFTVTDLLSKRYYWCTVHFGKLNYAFRAYGEGAPRDNNFITLRRDGAFINQKTVVISQH